MNDIIVDVDAGRYECMCGPIWVHPRIDMGSPERAVMGLESQAVSDWVTTN